MTLTGRHIELIGIGGCGMSGLARVLQARGAQVSGSDQVPSPTTEALEQDGITVSTDQSVASLKPDTDLVIATAALPADHPVLAKASSRGLELLLCRCTGQTAGRGFGISIRDPASFTAMCCHALCTRPGASFIMTQSPPT